MNPIDLWSLTRSIKEGDTLKLIDVANRMAPANKKRVARQKNKRHGESGRSGKGSFLDSEKDKYRSEILRNIKMY